MPEKYFNFNKIVNSQLFLGYLINNILTFTDNLWEYAHNMSICA